MRRRIRWAHPALLSTTLAVLAVAGLAETFAPANVHEPIERPAGVVMLLGAFLGLRVWNAAARGELELARSEEPLRMAQTAARMGTWDDDLVTGKTVWSDSLREVYGIGPEVEPGYESFLALVHRDDRDRVAERLARAHEEGGDFEVEYRLSPSEGETRWLLSRGRAIKANASTRILGVALDISERKAAEADREELELELRQAQKIEAVGRLRR
jgi:PAS domain S-box-containing protein